MQHRELTQIEIDQLLSQNCFCEDWSKVLVKPEFTTQHINNVTFSGNIKLGVFNRSYTLSGGLKRHSGISYATLHNCEVEDNTYISHIQRYIANYKIDSNTYIENVESIITDGESTFGNGVSVSALNESGGREILITDKLSSQLAYIQAIYRHKDKTIKKIQGITNKYINSIKSNTGYIGKNVTITSVGSIKNVKIGDCANINSAKRLVNGSINSNELDPVKVGNGVIAKNFIFSSGSQVIESSLVENCFIGQGTQIGKHFSIYDSVYFCNCQGFHGEACAIFGGPFTVTHHKSSLLIAGMFSFLNAGSGSNQSNHMYKLGPIHQGIVERGSKTTSDSYILWPAKIGAFSLVMGRHTHHPDTAEMPFSYLIENKNQTYLVPGVNIKSVGTVRDAQKWPKRDNRKDSELLDKINFNLLSPYIIQKMYNGIETLKKLKKISGENSDSYTYQNTIITNSANCKGIEYYNIAITKFLGNSIIKRLENTQFKNIQEIRDQLKPDTQIGLGKWLDISGMIAPRTEIIRLLDDIDLDNLNSIEQINERLSEIHDNYYDYEWIWALQKIEERFGKPYTEFTIEDILGLVEQWRKSVIGLDKMLYNDAKKEFTLISRTGFGADGGETTKINDFNNVRGKFEENPFVQEVEEHIESKNQLGQELIDRIKGLA